MIPFVARLLEGTVILDTTDLFDLRSKEDFVDEEVYLSRGVSSRITRTTQRTISSIHLPVRSSVSSE